MNNKEIDNLPVSVTLTFADLKLLEAAKKFGVLNEETAKQMYKENKAKVFLHLEEYRESVAIGRHRIYCDPCDPLSSVNTVTSIINGLRKVL